MAAPEPRREVERGSRPVRAGVFRKIDRADQAIAELVKAGFPKEDVTVICPTCTEERFEPYQRREPAGTKVPVAIVEGGAIGALLGGLGAIAGTGLLVAGTLLAGFGAIAGGFIGAMLTRGVERETTNFYDQSLRRGDILVAVEVERSAPDAAARLAEVERILSRAGAEPIPLPKG
jgi:uncharacterized protein YcfJ